MKNALLALLVIGLIAFSGCTSNQAPKPENTTTTTIAEGYMIRLFNHPVFEEIIIDKEGRTLYVFAGDESYKSNCYGECEENWPPFFIDGPVTMPPELERDIETIVRDTGKKQLAYKGKPLYYYINDKNIGDITGQGASGKWVVASTAPPAPKPEPTTTTVEEATTTTVSAAPTTTLKALSGVIKVEMKSGAFTPADIVITKGSTVDWVNSESIPHTVTSDFGDELDSDTLGRGQTYTHTFTKAGTYAYHCAFHTSMKGKITVV